MPMPFTRTDPNGVARTNFPDRAGSLLYPPYTGENVQYLTDRMRMPGGSRAGLERHGMHAKHRWRDADGYFIEPNYSSEPVS